MDLRKVVKYTRIVCQNIEDVLLNMSVFFSFKKLLLFEILRLFEVFEVF